MATKTQEALDAALLAACQLAGYRTPDLAAELIKRDEGSTPVERRVMRRLRALVNVARGEALDEAAGIADSGADASEDAACIRDRIRALPRKVTP